MIYGIVLIATATNHRSNFQITRTTFEMGTRRARMNPWLLKKLRVEKITQKKKKKERNDKQGGKTTDEFNCCLFRSIF